MSHLSVGIASLVTVALGLAWSSPAAAQTAKEEATRPRLGINLAGPADWNTELPFVDVFRLSRSWISQREGAPWGKGPKLDLDDAGWVRRLEPGCFAETPLCTIDGGHYPAGRYTVLYEGSGELDFWGAAKVATREPGRLTIDVDPSRGGFFLRLRKTDPADPVRNIRVIMPGFEESYAQEPWHPVFLERWRGVTAVRFMDFMHTNNSEIAHWDERPKPTDATFTRDGIALELLIDLANRLQADPWFCIPHKADDEYVRNFARLVEQDLDSNLNVYVEYSNEVWNGIFSQNRYAAERGQKLGFAEKPWEAAWYYTAHRSVEVFAIFEEEFGGTERLVRVLPTQSANPYVGQQVLGFRDAYRHADALAVAPYMGMNLRPGGNPSSNDVSGWSVDEALDYLENESLRETVGHIRANAELARKHGLALVAYEGGQHMVGVGGGENDEALTQLFHRANAHPRMGKIYDAYLAAWEDAGGGLFCHFSSVGRWSKWGSWGLLQHYDDAQHESSKFAAVARWAREQGQPLKLRLDVE